MLIPRITMPRITMRQGAPSHSIFTFSCRGGSHPGEHRTPTLLERHPFRTGNLHHAVQGRVEGCVEHCVGHGARLDDAVHELEDLRRSDDRIGDFGGLDQALLGEGSPVRRDRPRRLSSAAKVLDGGITRGELDHGECGGSAFLPASSMREDVSNEGATSRIVAGEIVTSSGKTLGSETKNYWVQRLAALAKGVRI
jgi:hypothetical protein